MAGHKLNPIFTNVLLAVFCTLVIMWISIGSPQMTGRLVDLVGKVLYVPEIPALELRSLVQAAGNWVLERKTLHDRNNDLELENLALRTTIQQMSVPQPESTATLIGAKVTLRYPDAWWKEIRVNRGAKDGVILGAPALSEGVMIGRVVRVGDDYAWIELITSSSFLLAAVVDETWDLGVINGDDRGNIWLLYMATEKKFKRGMTVSTALVGDYLPPGIPIGKIWGEGEVRDGFLPRQIVSGAHLTQLYGIQILSGRTRGAIEEGK